MASKTFNQSQPINLKPTGPSNETGFDFPFSPSEAGKFDFYRVHLANQAHQKDSMFSDHYETPNLSNETTGKHWTLFSNLPHLSDQPKSSSFSSLFSASKDSDGLANTNKTPNKPIQTVASFSSLTDAVKNAMHKGSINPGINQLRRPASGATLSTKDLNHLSPQSM